MKENRSTQRSHLLIRETFLQLLNEKPFEKITVTDIMNRADLNRSTFYKHYPDIYGIVEEIQNEIMEKNLAIIQKMKYRNILKDPMPYLKNLTATLEENTKLFSQIGHKFEIHKYLDKYCLLMTEDIIKNSTIPEASRHSALFSIQIHFFLGGIMNTYQQWAEGNLTYTLDEISKEIAFIIKKTGAEWLEKEWTA